MDEITILEKWLKQVKSGELPPTFIEPGISQEQAIQKLQGQIRHYSKNNQKQKIDIPHQH